MTMSAAWRTINDWFARSPRAVEVLPVDPLRARQVLEQSGLQADSPIGAIVLNSGGILVDRGWVRILGSGSQRMQGTLAHWNRPAQDGTLFVPDALVVAHDALGGVFAIDRGAFADGDGEAHYFSPDTLTWEGMEFGDSGLIEFLLTGDLDGFYGSFRWRHWAEDVAALSPDHGFHTYPPLWSKEGKDPEKVSRKPVEMTELVAVQWEYARQLANAESA